MRTVIGTGLILAAGLAAIPVSLVQGIYGWWHRRQQTPHVEPPSRDDIAVLLGQLSDERLQDLMTRWTREEHR